MKFLFDLFPVILFFSMFKWGESHAVAAQSLANQSLSGFISGGAVTLTQAPILLATAIAIAASIAQIGYLLLRRKKIDAMLWLSFGIIVIFGGATIYFHNDAFIKWKPTVLYWCMGGALLISQTLFGKNLIRTMLEDKIVLPERVWQRLGVAWAGFFVVMGLINLYVAFTFSTPTWVNFKLFGSTALIFIFAICQSVYLSKYMKETP